MKMGRFKLSHRTKRKISGFIFVLPFVIGFLIFFAMPLIQTIRYSFNNVSVGEKGGMELEFSGIQNYINLFTSEITTKSSTILRMLFDENASILTNTPIIVVFSLFMALLANRKFKGRTAVRVIFFLPIVLGIDVVVDMLTATTGSELAKSGGLFSQSWIQMMLLQYTSIPKSMVMSFTNFADNIFTVISQVGVQTLVYLAALQSISPSLYEVAKIEGATNYEIFWKVTIPLIMHITMFVIIYTIVDLFLNSSIAAEVYSFAFDKNKIGVGSALSIVYIFNVLLLLGIVLLIMRKLVKRDDK
jgi:ABC-type sugar transport system permease subunit